MFGTALLTLVLVAQQVATHPPVFTLNADHPPSFTLNDDADVQTYNGPQDEGEERIRILPVVVPFENSNPMTVAGLGELYQSDMLLSEEQWTALRMRKAISNDNYRWSEGSDGYPLVPYVFQDSVNKDDVRAALDHWMENTCIKFKKTSNTDQPHLQFHIGVGCSSNVGMIYFRNGQQISIGPGCNSLGTVVHEVGHAMGFYHEQSRSDRDDHVIILTDNIKDGKENNFDKEADNSFSVPYDYASNMHYGQDYFSVNGKPTIVTLDPMAQELIGSRNGLTHRDKLLANRMYNCIGKWLEKCKLGSEESCLNGGYTGKDCTCVCPPGTTGLKCKTIVGDYYDDLRNPLSEKIFSEKSISVETPMSSGITFVKWIVPSTCKKAKLVFTSSDMYTGDCYFQSLNVKTDSLDYEGQTLCAADVTTGLTLESDTGIIITMTNRIGYGSTKTLWAVDLSTSLTDRRVYGSTKTLWAADVTFESISGCTATDPPTPATLPPPVTESPTTPSPAPILECEKRPKTLLMPTGTSVTIISPNYPDAYPAKSKCVWKLKPPKQGSLTFDCDQVALNGKDKLKVNKKSYTDSTGPLTSKKLSIQFKSGKKSTGPGFKCTVVSE